MLRCDTQVDIATFAMEKVNSEKQLLHYALDGGHVEGLFRGSSEFAQSMPQGIRRDAYVYAIPALGEEGVSSGKTVTKSRVTRITRFYLPENIYFMRYIVYDALGGE